MPSPQNQKKTKNPRIVTKGRVITSEEHQKQLKDKLDEMRKKETEKEARKKDRELKRLEKEKAKPDKENKQKCRENQRKGKGKKVKKLDHRVDEDDILTCRQERPKRNKVKNAFKELVKNLMKDHEDDDSSDESSNDGSANDDDTCNVCDQENPPVALDIDQEIGWIQCDTCDLWYHKFCVYRQDDDDDDDNDSFVCDKCL